MESGDIVDAELRPSDISNSCFVARLLCNAGVGKPVWTRLTPGEKKSSSSFTGLTIFSGTGLRCMGDLLHSLPIGPAARGVGVGETERARRLACETSMVGASASSPPSPITIGDASVNVTLIPLALPLPFESELTDWLRP